jgi:hypothetical protein
VISRKRLVSRGERSEAAAQRSFPQRRKEEKPRARRFSWEFERPTYFAAQLQKTNSYVAASLRSLRETLQALPFASLVFLLCVFA